MSNVKATKQNPLAEYLEESVQEIKKVTWPTRNQAVRLTLLVLGFCFAAAVVIGAMDALFSLGHQKLVDLAASTNPQEIVIPDETVTVPVTADATGTAATAGATADGAATTEQ